jgi:formylmethanofuran dehydrogenase subunit E
MKYPEFFNQIETIKLKEPLGEALGSFDGDLEFSYADCVKMAGHSCPTLSGAYLMALYGIKALYGNDTAIRGELKVEFREAKNSGVTGVIASVFSYITGAKEEDGFKGLGGKFCRVGLLSFSNNIKGEIRLTRTDSGKSVELSYPLSCLKLAPLDPALFQKIASGSANKEEISAFKELWQQRVKEILLTYKDRAVEIDIGQ